MALDIEVQVADFWWPISRPGKTGILRGYDCRVRIGVRHWA
jgi:hypothetical protein